MSASGPSRTPGGLLRSPWLRRGVLLLRSLCVTIGVAFLLVTLTPLDYWWAKALTGPSWETEGDVLVILGGGEWDGGQLAWKTYLRTSHALFLYRHGHFSTIVVSGGGVPPVADAIRDYLVAGGVPDGIILRETGSHSTRDNALYCKPILERLGGRKLLLTSDYHTFRAVRAFRATGIEVLPSPAPDILKQYKSMTARWTCFLQLVKETLSVAYYGARGWL